MLAFVAFVAFVAGAVGRAGGGRSRGRSLAVLALIGAPCFLVGGQRRCFRHGGDEPEAAAASAGGAGRLSE